MSRALISIVLAIGLSLLSLRAISAPASDPYFNSTGSWQQEFLDQWAAHAVLGGQPAVPRGSEAVLIALIDTGVDYAHEDFPRESLWRNANEVINGRDDDDNGYVDDVIGWDFVGHSNNPIDQSGHGTHLAGLIAACTNNGLGIAGIAPGARLLPLKAATFAGSASAEAVAGAVRYAVAAKADIINISLAREIVTSVETLAIADAVEAGVLVIASAGNDASKTAPSGYAGLPGVLAVAASDQNGERAGFSAANVEVDLIAPGVDVLSLRATGTDFIALSSRTDYRPGAAVVGEDYYRASGTSFATALVTGVAARLAAARPELDGAGLSAVLMASARDVATDGIDQLSGHGEVSLAGALTAQPDSFVDLRLTGIGLADADGEVVLELHGRAPADGSAWLELAELDSEGAPGQVQRLPHLVVGGPVLARLSFAELVESSDSHGWQFRLHAANAGGAAQSSAIEVALPRVSPRAKP